MDKQYQFHILMNKGLGSLTINFCPANFEKRFFTKNFKILQWLQKNLFTVNKWIFTTLKSNLYKRKLV